MDRDEKTFSKRQLCIYPVKGVQDPSPGCGEKMGRPISRDGDRTGYEGTRSLEQRQLVFVSDAFFFLPFFFLLTHLQMDI